MDYWFFYSDKKEQLQKYQKLLIIINPTNANQTFHTDEYFASLTRRRKRSAHQE